MTAQFYYNWDNPPNSYEFNPADAIESTSGFWVDFGDWKYMFQDEDMTMPITAIGQKIMVVQDKSNPDRTFYAYEEETAPVSAIANGFKCADFASGCFLYSSNIMSLATCKGYIIFEGDSTASFQRLVSSSAVGNDTSGNASLAIHTGDLNAHFGVRARSAALDTRIGTSGVSPFGLYEYEIQGANAQCYFNGTAGVGDASASGLTATSDGGIVIGMMSENDAPSGVGPFDGRIWNIVHLDTIPSSTINTKIKNWLNTYRY